MHQLEIASSLEKKAAQLRQEGLAQMKTAFVGIPVPLFINYFTTHFGEEMDVDEENLSEEERLEAAEEPPTPTGEAFPIENCKIVFPTTNDREATGVPQELRPKRFTPPGGSVSRYPCGWEGCSAIPGQKQQAWIHIRKMHLGQAFGCIYCTKEDSASHRWFSFVKWEGHMKSCHPDSPHFAQGSPSGDQPSTSGSAQPRPTIMVKIKEEPMELATPEEFVEQVPILESIESARREQANRALIKSTKPT